MVRESRHTLLAIIMAGLLVLSGCGGAGSDVGVSGSGGAEFEGGGDGGDAPPRATGMPNEADVDDGGADGDEQLSSRTQRFVRRGHVELEVGNADAAQQNISRLVEEFDGFISQSHLRRHQVWNASYKSGMVVARVPSENFTQLVESVEREGTVETSQTSREDVSDQLVDIEARLNNLRSQRDQLRTLFEQANDTQSVLQVQQRLGEVQQRIERLEARKQALEEQVAYSTLRIEFTEPRPDPERPVKSRWYDTPVVSAFLDSVEGVLTTLRAMVVLGAYALPYLLVYGVPVIGVGVLWWRRRRNGSLRQLLPNR